MAEGVTGGPGRQVCLSVREIYLRGVMGGGLRESRGGARGELLGSRRRRCEMESGCAHLADPLQSAPT